MGTSKKINEDKIEEVVEKVEEVVVEDVVEDTKEQSPGPEKSKDTPPKKRRRWHYR